MGTGDTTDRATPVPVFYGAKAISAGYSHSLALMADGTVWAWGRNGEGQLGVGDFTDVVGGTGATGTVTLSAVAGPGGQTLSLSSSDSSVATVPPSVSVPAGSKTATFAINTKPVGNTKAVTITATGLYNAASTTLTVQP